MTNVRVLKSVFHIVICVMFVLAHNVLRAAIEMAKIIATAPGNLIKNILNKNGFVNWTITISL